MSYVRKNHVLPGEEKEQKEVGPEVIEQKELELEDAACVRLLGRQSTARSDAVCGHMS